MHLNEMAADSAKKAQNHYERADYYQKQENYQQALEEYAQSLKYYAWFLQFSERNFIRYEKTNDSKNFGLDTQISVLVWLGILMTKIETCYSQQQEYSKAAIFIKNLKEIVEVLGRFKKSFNVNILKTYERLTEGTKYAEANISLRTNEIEANSQSNSIDDSDATFKELCLEFDKCCSYEICALSSRDVDESSSSSNSCFIATAAYSTSTHPDIDTFRNFRDKKLLTNPVGQGLVSLYYNISPSIAKYLEKQPIIKSFLRQQLERLAEWMRSREFKS